MGERGRLLAADVAVLCERGEGPERIRLPHPVVAVTVHELQQLDGELDVAQPAWAELELNIHFIGGNVLGDPLAHALHRVNEPLALRAVPHEGMHRCAVALPQRDIARQRARLQQRLKLPRLRPALVVGTVRVDRAHQGAVLALGPQVRVDFPQRRLDSGLLDAAGGL